MSTVADKAHQRMARGEAFPHPEHTVAKMSDTPTVFAVCSCGTTVQAQEQDSQLWWHSPGGGRTLWTY